jgi:hypothetical protein
MSNIYSYLSHQHQEESPLSTTPVDENKPIQWSLSLPFMKTRTYCYNRHSLHTITSEGQEAFIMCNTSIQEAIPMPLFSYQVMDYSQQVVLIQQPNDISFVCVRYHDPNVHLPQYLINTLLSWYVPYFVRKIHTSCKTLKSLETNKAILDVQDVVVDGFNKAFV